MNNQIVGEAEIQYGNGNYYVGGYDRGEKNGFGKFKSIFYEYEGGWKDNLFDGEGYLVDYTKQIKATSHFKRHKMNGQTKITNLIDTPIFDGEMEEDKKTGYGKLAVTNLDGSGFTYTGYFKDDLKDGFGSFYDLRTKVKYVGEFRRDKEKVKANDGLFYSFHEEIVEEEEGGEDGAQGTKTGADKTAIDSKKKTSHNNTTKNAININNASSGVILENVSNVANLGGTKATEENLKPKMKEVVEEEGSLVVSQSQGSEKSGNFNLRMRVIYQPPDYPDPNPPEQPVKKNLKASRGKAGTKSKSKLKSKRGKNNKEDEVVEEPEIPMITPPWVFVNQESGRLFKIELFRGSKDDEAIEKEKHVLVKFDFRKQIGELREKERQIMLAKQKEMDENSLDKPEKGSKRTLKKSKSRAARRREKDRGKGKKESKDPNEKEYETISYEIYDSGSEGDEANIVFLRAKEGIVDLLDLEFPPNFPSGGYYFRATDVTPWKRSIDFVPPKELSIVVGSDTGVKKRRGKR